MTDISSKNCYQSIMRAHDFCRNDPARPGYHFTPPAMWMNDPNGALEIDGWRHIFYLHDPFSANGKSTAVYPGGRMVSGDKNPNRVWGHVKTRDFINWFHCPPALVPNREAGELKPISGSSILLPDGIPIIMYTSVSGDYEFCQRISFGDKELNNFEQCEIPVIERFMPNMPILDNKFRDPFMIEHSGCLYAVVAAQTGHDASLRSVLVLFRANGSIKEQWTYCGILLERSVDDVPYFECPKLFALDGKWVLVFSPFGPPRYFVGELDLPNCMFSVEKEGYVDNTPYAYATTSLQIDNGETYLLSWIPGWNKNHYVSDHWGGCLSIPHKLNLNDDLELLQKPATALDSLQYGSREAVQGMQLPKKHGWKLEVDELGETGSVCLINNDGVHVLGMHWDEHNLKVNGISLDSSRRGKTILYLDRTVWELFAADGCYCFSGMLTTHEQLYLHYCGCPSVPIIWDLRDINTSFV